MSKVVFTAVWSLLYIAILNPSFARAPGSGWISKQEALRKVQELGYGKALSIVATKNSWQVVAGKSGKFYALSIEPFKGELLEAVRSKSDDFNENNDDDFIENLVGEKCRVYIGEKCKTER